LLVLAWRQIFSRAERPACWPCDSFQAGRKGPPACWPCDSFEAGRLRQQQQHSDFLQCVCNNVPMHLNI
jgi:hypothetical protein